MHNFCLHLIIEIFECVMEYIVFKYMRRINQIERIYHLETKMPEHLTFKVVFDDEEKFLNIKIINVKYIEEKENLTKGRSKK